MKLTLPPMLNTNLEPDDLGDQIASLWLNLVLKDGRNISIPVMKHFDKELATNYLLTPLAMRVPNSRGIYALSKLSKPKIISIDQFARFNSVEMLVSFEIDGISGPVLTTAYGYGLDCWYLAELVTQDVVHELTRQQ